MSNSPDLGICRLCFASEAANFDRTFRTFQLPSAFYSFAAIDIPRCQEVPQKICGHCEKNIEEATMLRTRIRFSSRVWAKFTKAQGIKDEKPPKEDLDVSLNCHMCGQCFNYEDLLAHITNDHGADHLSDCDLCQVLATHGGGDETTLLLDSSTVYEEVIEEMNEEILEAPLPDGEQEISDIKVGSEDEKDPEYELANDDADDVDDDEGEDEEEGEEQVAEDDDIGESVNMDESTMVRLIINEEGIKMRRYHCPTCDKSYARTDKLRNHMKQEHNQRLEKKPPNPNPNQPKTSLHTCNWCGLTFPELTELDTHLLVHDRQKPFICLKCDKSFLNRGALIAHSVTHQKKAARADKDRKFQCRYCKRGYCRLEQLRRHVEAVHPDLDIIVALDGLENERFECPICDASYTRIEKLDLHMMTHDDTPFHCDRCDMAFKSRRELRNHDVCKADVVMVACEICPQTFTSERLRDLHTEHVHDSRVFSCPDCDREFDTRNRLVSHKRTVHEKMFECPICHKTLSRQDKLDYHMRQHNGFPCTECSTTFQTRKEWREHLVSVHNSTEGEDNGAGSAATGAAAAGETVKTPRPKPFRCDLCCASYTTQQKLDVHVRDGHSAEGYSCEHCELKFESKAKLKAHTYKHNQKLCGICGLWITSSYASHVRRHQGIKPHKCLVEGCGKEFLRNCDLTSHTKTHTGEKPFPCDICGMRFSRPYKVTVHKRTHTGVRPYKCDFENCQRDFAQSFDLTLHMRRHTGEKPYSCERCGEGFILTSILKKHQQNCAAIMIVIAEEEQEVVKMETH